MMGIGMNFAAESQVGADIEVTLMHASRLGMDEGEPRVLSVPTTWMGVHHAHVNADRLVRLVVERPSSGARFDSSARWRPHHGSNRPKHLVRFTDWTGRTGTAELHPDL